MVVRYLADHVIYLQSKSDQERSKRLLAEIAGSGLDPRDRRW
jgi:hypothetical protein